jgi:hypothetical protein
MSNKDLLKQAIAEAKTIREAAIANAKEALEETLTPHLKEMLAQKLQEMENDEDKMEETVDENIYEAEEEEVETPEEDEAAEGEESEEEEELEIEDMSVEDLKDLIRDIVAQEVGHDEEAEIETGEEAPEGGDMTSMDDSEEIDINELLAELEGMDKKGMEEYGSTTMADPSSSAAAGLDNIVSMVKSIKSSETLAKVKEFLKGLPAGAGAALAKEEIDEYGSTTMGDPGSSAAAGLENIISMIKSLKSPETVAKVKEFLKGLPAGASAAMRAEGSEEPKMEAMKTKRMEEDLNEALQAVKILRNQLQEVNLLNAKLLYVNKVFKSNNLSEGQKVNVIAAFDKAETVKEVKLVFETVSKNVVAKPAAIKEHRSFASKATGNAQTTAPKEIISEVSEQVQRWQKLAGIIKS